VADRIASRHGEPTEFELLTAMIFRWFAEEHVEVALVEVGLGGRLDATHAWDGGVAAITNVDLDHMDRLGSTVTAIAREKAAIIERGDVAVTGATGDGLAVIRRRAARMGVPLTIVAPAPMIRIDRDGLEVELPRVGRTRVGLRGRHQASNVAVADAVLDALEVTGIATASAAQRREGYGRAVWPGRLELLDVDGRDVLLDGAHNPAGAATLATALDDLRPFLRGGSPTLVMATMADKDVDGIIRALAASAALRGARIVCTQLHTGRALPAEALAARWQALAPRVPVGAEPDALHALDSALGTGSGPVIVAGSLYLVGAARARLVDDPLLRDPEPGTSP
jgi:dihydrofolate synthase / folylpolyglutamate synthase